jgi:hypothetical protein
MGTDIYPKQAWRKLNHNFHGKKPGAKKVCNPKPETRNPNPKIKRYEY